MNEIDKFKIEVFDIINHQGILYQQWQTLEIAKKEKLQKIEQLLKEKKGNDNESQDR